MKLGLVIGLASITMACTAIMGARPVSADNPKKVELVILLGTTMVSVDEVQSATDAIQTQLDRDFTPYWGVRGILYGPKDKAPKTAVPVRLEDWADNHFPEELGFHDGKPRGFVFVKSSILFGAHWTKILSHEILEILSDFKADQLVVWDANHLVSSEAADPVEAFEYQINGVYVSDFVTPAWFYLDKGLVMDHMRMLSKPHEIVKDRGYMDIYELRTKP